MPNRLLFKSGNENMRQKSGCKLITAKKQFYDLITGLHVWPAFFVFAFTYFSAVLEYISWGYVADI